jgi:hypothetical protein
MPNSISTLITDPVGQDLFSRAYPKVSEVIKRAAAPDRNSWRERRRVLGIIEIVDRLEKPQSPESRIYAHFPGKGPEIAR